MNSKDFKLGTQDALDRLSSATDNIYVFDDRNYMYSLISHPRLYVVFDSLLSIDSEEVEFRLHPLNDYEICYHQGYHSTMGRAIKKKFPRNYIKKQIKLSKKIIGIKD